MDYQGQNQYQPQNQYQQPNYQPQNQYQQPSYQPQNQNMESNIPPQYKPLSPWAYFGYNLLYAIPLVGFIFLIINSFNKDNINRRNHARSFFCALCIIIPIYIILIIIAAVAGFSASSYYLY